MNPFVDYALYRSDIARSPVWRRRWLAVARYREERGHHYVKPALLPDLLKF